MAYRSTLKAGGIKKWLLTTMHSYYNVHSSPERRPQLVTLHIIAHTLRVLPYNNNFESYTLLVINDRSRK